MRIFCMNEYELADALARDNPTHFKGLDLSPKQRARHMRQSMKNRRQRVRVIASSTARKFKTRRLQ